MKNILASHSTQSGVSLVIALLLLLVLTVLGVASMSGSLMQERMAGNVNLQTLAFEAASAGVSGSAEFGLDKDKWPAGATCARGSGNWDPLPDWSDWSDPLFDDGTLPPDVVVEYRRRIGCFEPDPIPPAWADPDFSVPTQLLVLNQGRVRRGKDVPGEDVPAEDVLAMREIEVRVENRGDSQCAIRIEGAIGSVTAPSSQFSVDGKEGGCPLSVSEGGNAGDLIAAIEQGGGNKIGNYEPVNPGIHESVGFAPWNDAERFAEIANGLKTAVQAYQHFKDSGFSTQSDQVTWRAELLFAIDEAEGAEAQYLTRLHDFAEGKDITKCSGTFREGSTKASNSAIPGGQCDIDHGTAASSDEWPNSGNDMAVGDPDDPTHITYVAGHIGNPGSDGSGILISEGGSCWSANATFKGLQLILGGHYEMIGGGGNKDSTDGAIVLTRLNKRYGSDTPDFWELRGSDRLRDLAFDAFDESEDGFSNTDLFFAGGGGHSINFVCDGDESDPGMFQFVEKINSCLQLDEPLEPNCDPDGGRRKAIASWREYVDRARWP